MLRDRLQLRPNSEKPEVFEAPSLSRWPGGGTVWLFGAEITVSKPWNRYLVVNRATRSVTTTNTPRPSPLPDGEEWYDLNRTFGEIHITGWAGD